MKTISARQMQVLEAMWNICCVTSDRKTCSVETISEVLNLPRHYITPRISEMLKEGIIKKHETPTVNGGTFVQYSPNAAPFDFSVKGRGIQTGGSQVQTIPSPEYTDNDAYEEIYQSIESIKNRAWNDAIDAVIEAIQKLKR